MKKGSSSPAGFFLKALKIAVAILMLNVEKYLFYNGAIYIIIISSSSIETANWKMEGLQNHLGLCQKTAS